MHSKTYLLAVACVVVVAGCGEPSKDCFDCSPHTPPLRQVLESSPGVMRFSQTPVGESSTQEITISNVGWANVDVTNVALRENSGRDFDGRREFFEAGSGWAQSEVSLEPSESVTLAVEYRPLNSGEDSGLIVVEALGQSLSIPIETPRMEPAIYAPARVRFRRLLPRPHEPDWRGDFQILRVSNLGGESLRIDDMHIVDSDDFALSFLPSDWDRHSDAPLPEPSEDTLAWPSSVAPGDSFGVRIWARPDDNLPEHGRLVIESNDPDNPSTVVELLANSGTPCIDLLPRDEVHFGGVLLGGTATHTVSLRNCSRSEPLEISEIALTGNDAGVFSIEYGEDFATLPVVLAPRQTQRFEVVAQPTEGTNFDAELLISNTDPARSNLRLPIFAGGRHAHCPQPRATAWIDGNDHRQTTIHTIPLNTIQFDGSSSHSPNGDIVDYRWTIVSRPQGSTQRLLPNNSTEQPKLFLDLAGTYEIELEVTDSNGDRSCGEPARITIRVTLDDDVHVQLIWNTPSDPDQTDGFGTDIDLHYLHPNGRWDDPPWDIFWRNPTADWNEQGDASDDPSLDIDDTDGAGPENINHSGLERETYRVGVYYYSDSTLGASWVTVRIYVGGVLQYTLEDYYMPRTGSFLDVATIEWPSAAVSEIARESDGFPDEGRLEATTG